MIKKQIRRWKDSLRYSKILDKFGMWKEEVAVQRTNVDVQKQAVVSMWALPSKIRDALIE
jgi:hypothetical protein